MKDSSAHRLLLSNVCYFCKLRSKTETVSPPCGVIRDGSTAEGFFSELHGSHTGFSNWEGAPLLWACESRARSLVYFTKL